MELNVDQLEVKIKQLESDLKFQEEILQKAEKYERLMQDSDFKDFLHDFKEGFAVHSLEIERALNELSTSSPRQQEDLFRIILIHQSKKEMVEGLVERPAEIVELAKEARKKIPQIQEQINNAKEELR